MGNGLKFNWAQVKDTVCDYFQDSETGVYIQFQLGTSAYANFSVGTI